MESFNNGREQNQFSDSGHAMSHVIFSLTLSLHLSKYLFLFPCHFLLFLLFLHFQLFSSPLFPPLFLPSLPLLAAMGDTFSPLGLSAKIYIYIYHRMHNSVKIWECASFSGAFFMDILYLTVITNKAVLEYIFYGSQTVYMISQNLGQYWI